MQNIDSVIFAGSNSLAESWIAAWGSDEILVVVHVQLRWHTLDTAHWTGPQDRRLNVLTEERISIKLLETHIDFEKQDSKSEPRWVAVSL